MAPNGLFVKKASSLLSLGLVAEIFRRKKRCLLCLTISDQIFGFSHYL
jgi:hypothetical protein